MHSLDSDQQQVHKLIPDNSDRRWPNIDLSAGHRLRRWPTKKPLLGQSIESGVREHWAPCWQDNDSGGGCPPGTGI